MLKRMGLAVVFTAVAAFSMARPVVAHTGTKEVKVNTSTTAEGLCYGRCAPTAPKAVTVNTSTTVRGICFGRC